MSTALAVTNVQSLCRNNMAGARTLMDGRQDGLTVIGKLAHQLTDRPGRLRVETTRGLVEEHQKLRLGHQFDGDGQPLTLLHVQTLARDTDQGSGIGLHFQQLDDLIHVRQLLSLGDRFVLTEHGAEFERLPDSGSSQVQILLLDIACLALERLIPFPAIDKHLARHDSYRNTSSENIQERRFPCKRSQNDAQTTNANTRRTGTTDSHQRSQRPGLDPTIDVIQQPPVGAILQLDVIADVFPQEDLLLRVDFRFLSRRLPGLQSNRLLARSPILGISGPTLGRKVPAEEDQNFALGFERRDVLGGKQMDTTEDNLRDGALDPEEQKGTENLQ
ncbi:unnamed protein product [Mycena citricolor]|uniref:Uncharacterized protein n=1 Tax=Mycena citricolor TaxID=2018698 RepID=A0AAD2HCI4_9AGAR|nr:unnamed protein product [Mycena citricolor]